jgi:CRP/FNR family transcriptional regulator
MFDAALSTTHSNAGSTASPFRTHAPTPADRTSIDLASLVAGLGGTLPPDSRFEGVRFPLRSLHAGQVLHRAGDSFESIHAVRCGFFKTVCVDVAGTEQVLSFPMGGDLVGLDGVGQGRYATDVIALDTSQVAVISFERLAQLGRRHPPLERLIYRLFSRELVREHTMMCVLGVLTADARVATFMLDLSERFSRLGCSRSAFVLRMTRQDIGSYLGIQLETVSRTLSAFCAAGLIGVDGKAITLRDIPGLRHIATAEHDEAAVPARSVRRAAA